MLDRELQTLRSKELVKGRKSDDGSFITVLSDTLPPTPVRDDYFSPPPVDLADDSFALPDVLTKPLIAPKPAITKPTIAPKPLLDRFSKPLTKIIDSKKKIKYK